MKESKAQINICYQCGDEIIPDVFGHSGYVCQDCVLLKMKKYFGIDRDFFNLQNEINKEDNNV